MRAQLQRLTFTAVLAISTMFQVAAPARPAEPPHLRIVYNALGGSMAPIWIAQEMNLFAKHGLQHNLNYLAATTAVQAMAAGSEEIGLVGNQGIDVGLEGADTIYVASTVPKFIFRLYGDPSIQSINDLKGKVVAATQPAASTDYATRMVLRRFDLTPDKDVKIVYAGSMPALLTMLNLAMLKPAWYARRRLSRRRIWVSSRSSTSPSSTSRSYFSVLRRRTVSFSRSRRRLPVFCEPTPKRSPFFGATRTPLSRQWESFSKPTSAVLWKESMRNTETRSRKPFDDPRSSHAVLDVAKSPKAQQAKPEDFFDNSFLQKLESSGFIDSLYAR